ncbi:Release factor glutamine methyltransferase [Planctomycetes bacterium Poly30]|uniref:Release factor glutamine methyltransferase n=2 Tax=Saltatorellus ferox TaxID=2528018 RepID=A0A518ESF0_9BACT|nr:Release factor glutamine methyltransferase [Planctomycetes bacterium Poly30]
MLALARAFLERKGLGEARLEAELLVGHSLGLDRLGLYMRLDQPLLPAEVDRARDLLVRRGRREPTAYIVGAREFYARDFFVGPGVLVPRPETELIVDRAREIISGWREAEPGGESLEADRDAVVEPIRLLDIGTGSGCLAVTLALVIPEAEVHAVDLSEEALVWARKNAEALGAAVRFHHGDGLEVALALAKEHGPFDLVVSNPPYIEPRERETLSAEVREHEPPLALYSPAEDPDFWVRSLAERAGALLAVERGRCLVELGHLQGARLAGVLGQLPGGAVELTLHRDLAGIPRVAEFGRPT